MLNLYFFLLLGLILVVDVVSSAKDDGQQDLYIILGVKRSATTKQIKQAYRKKARDTHPDKNTNIPPEEAATKFHAVVHAFEILSDESSRKRYDRTGYSGSSSDTDSGSNSGGGYGGFGGGGFYGGGFQFFFNQRGPRQKLKDKFEVKQAMSRVLHVVSLEQLKIIMLDDNDVLERHLLMAFVTPDKIETHVNDEMVYPYPFAHKSSQGIWWEDIVQTVMVRFHKGNDITRFFNLPDGTDMKKPIFMFGRRGDVLSPDNFQRYETDRRKDFEAWVWKMIEVVVYFKNEHTHPVEIYWIHHTRANMKGIVQPNETVKHTSMLTHEFMIRDLRVDSRTDSPGRWKLGDNSSLGTYKIGIEGECPPIRDEDGTISIVIKTLNCTDMSGHCSFWKHHDNACTNNPNFMNDECPLTCGFCQEDENDEEPEEEQPTSEGGSTTDDSASKSQEEDDNNNESGEEEDGREEQQQGEEEEQNQSSKDNDDSEQQKEEDDDKSSSDGHNGSDEL